MESRYKEILNERGYDLLELIGKGGYAVCYKVRSQKWNIMLACKIVYMNNEEKNGSIDSVHDEVNVLMNLYHSNLIHLYDNFIVDNYGFMIIDYCPNGTIKRYNRKNNRVSRQTLDLFLQVLQGVNYMHKNGYAHHDIKSANILMDETRRPKIADFGMCKHYSPDKLCSCYKGSKQYACPEIHQHIPYDPFKGDIWSLGICFFDVIYHKLPWPKDKDLLQASIIEGGPIIPPKLPFNMSRLLMRMTAMNPNARPTAAQCIEFIEKEKASFSVAILLRMNGRFCLASQIKKDLKGLIDSQRNK